MAFDPDILAREQRAIEQIASGLTTGGPLFAMHAAIAARLAAVFPPARFEHAMLPAKMTAREFDRLVRRTPFVGLGWGAVVPNPNSGRLLRGQAQWSLVLINKNSDVAARHLGDAYAPGLFGLVQIAASALHGWTLAGEAIPGAGTVAVTEVANLYADDWGSEQHGVAGLTLSVEFLLTDAELLGEFLRLGAAWQFDPATPDAPLALAAATTNVRTA